MNKNVSHLTDAIHAIRCLRLLRRIPMTFEMDDVIRGGDGKADARGEWQKDANAKIGRALKRFDHAEAGAVHCLRRTRAGPSRPVAVHLRHIEAVGAREIRSQALLQAFILRENQHIFPGSADAVEDFEHDLAAGRAPSAEKPAPAGAAREERERH